MVNNIPKSSKEDINDQLAETSNAVTHYINQIQAQPDDFAQVHLKALQESIERTNNALLKYEFKKEHFPLTIDETLKTLSQAVSFLNEKGKQEQIKTKIQDNHIELSSELVVALNAIQNLVALLEELQETRPILGVSVEDKSYKRGEKIVKATKKKFKNGKS